MCPLTRLNLTGNPLGDDGAVLLARGLGLTREVCVLGPSTARAESHDDGESTTAKASTTMACMRELVLSDCSIGQRGCLALVS
jgi:hypothetical protein